MAKSADDDHRFMARALALAERSQGCVEPNPMVGCVITRDGSLIGEGAHYYFGGPHAEVTAIQAAEGQTAGATVYVTLEPCSHYGKTPPCAAALIQAGVSRVVIAMEDPFPQVCGRGIAALRDAGIDCEVGVLAKRASALNAPYLKLLTHGKPWVIAKWAMTLDGKIATRTGDSKWISSEASRSVVHQLRGRVDAIMIGSGTARTDDPMLTARPVDPADRKRWAMPIVVDSAATLDPNCRLLRNRSEGFPLVAVGASAPEDACQRLVEAGAQVYRCAGATHAERLESLLSELGQRRATNVLVEGGGRLMGTLFEMHAIDEVHVFIAPKIAGGEAAPRAIGGAGIDRMTDALSLRDITIEELDGDVYVHGRVNRELRV